MEDKPQSPAAALKLINEAKEITAALRANALAALVLLSDIHLNAPISFETFTERAKNLIHIQQECLERAEPLHLFTEEQKKELNDLLDRIKAVEDYQRSSRK